MRLFFWRYLISCIMAVKNTKFGLLGLLETCVSTMVHSTFLLYWIITASNRKVFHEKGNVLEPIVAMLSSSDPQAQRNAAGALANLSPDNGFSYPCHSNWISAQIQRRIGELGALSQLVSLLQSEHLPCRAMAARALCNISELGTWWNWPLLTKF